MSGGSPSQFWAASLAEVMLMLQGYARRLLNERRTAALLYCWIESVVVGSHSRPDRLVPDPDDQSINLDDFESVEAFDLAVAGRGR